MNSVDSRSLPVLEGHDLRQAIRGVIGKFIDFERYDVFIFGSEASGVAGSRSDIDIGILGPGPVPGAVMQQIRDELENLRTLRGFDLVDFARVDESFRTEALQHVDRL